MGKLICLLLLPCRWLHITDFMDDPAHYRGLYQCTRCKTISMGAHRDAH